MGRLFQAPSCSKGLDMSSDFWSKCSRAQFLFFFLLLTMSIAARCSIYRHELKSLWAFVWLDWSHHLFSSLSQDSLFSSPIIPAIFCPSSNSKQFFLAVSYWNCTHPSRCCFTWARTCENSAWRYLSPYIQALQILPSWLTHGGHSCHSLNSLQTSPLYFGCGAALP